MPQTPHPWRAGLGLLLAAGLMVAACSMPGRTASTPTTQTSVVKLGAVETTVNATGSVKALADVTLSRESGGSITAVLVKTGDRVAAGQPLLRVDTRELELQLAQAEASLTSAQASHAQKQAGATQKELEQAEATLRSAQAQYQQTQDGATTAQDIANAEAALRSAQARYQQTLTGTTTAQDIANAEAALRSAEAKLAATVAGTAVAADLASAEAALRSAQAKLDDLRAGPKPADVEAKRLALSQATDARAKSESQLSLAKEQARLAIEAAANDLRSAQASFGAAKLIWEEAERTGKDPNIPVQKNPTNKDYRDLTDAKRRQYKNDYESAERAMTNAEQALEQKQLAYEDAKKQEMVGLQTADSQVRAAQLDLDTLLAGATALELAQAQTSVDQAQATLDKLREPVKATDITQAQAAVDQARANLDKLRRPADPNDVAQAKATVDQAQAALDKLSQPVKATQLTQAQATVDQAQATLKDLKAGATVTDLAVALASVKQAEATRDLRRLELAQATLTAPFAGVVAGVAAMPGQQTADNANLITLVDDSTLSIDVNVAENDIATIALGQLARATFAALPDRTVAGKVAAIAPKSTVQSNVVSYLVTVALDNTVEAAVKTGMTANVALITAQKSGVLTVPNKAIQTQGQQKLVMVQAQGQSVSTPVQLGLAGDSLTEIVAGLKEGDVVAIGGTATTARTTTNQPSLGIPGTGPISKP